MIKGISALELLHRETASTNRIKTLCRALDKMLCGGIIIGKGIVELCGVPGSGKTLLCKLLALNIQIPKSIGGPGLNAIYIDTEGGFSKNRLREISKNTLSYIHEKNKFGNITNKNLIENVKYIRIFDLEELLNVLFIMPSQKIAKILENMSKEYSLSIIVTNHMTKKYIDNDQKKKKEKQPTNSIEEKYLEPSLGLSWNSLICERLILKRERDLTLGSEILNKISVTNSFGEIAYFKVIHF
ncbi:uncharacterized protein cubi_01363 [Cryptosporidium ubiquitum]|uniref:DNA repair protein RAD51 homolog 3 n=1 Tax=Cryptosporidium ubiquitum TaxID=857276 RepID=A0A1J4MCT5_9CRYT|nr:uncharacterized protein cubi_01363 [Cryptosporidium ubiquitum]OII72030.1 hypothetical protein cubi_01363 [Cryptosporidium ubiquitum]